MSDDKPNVGFKAWKSITAQLKDHLDMPVSKSTKQMKEFCTKCELSLDVTIRELLSYRLIQQASAGEVKAMQMILDRADGPIDSKLKLDLSVNKAEQLASDIATIINDVVKDDDEKKTIINRILDVQNKSNEK